MKKELITLSVRVPSKLREVMELYLQCNLHTNLSEFTRDAVREKIQREAPHLSEQLLQGVSDSD